MRNAFLAAVISFAVTAAIGPFIITWLRKMKLGQKILEIGPKWHMNKQNIPTMGGFMFIIGIIISVIATGILTGILRPDSPAPEVWHYFAVLLLALAYGLIGCIDDYAKIKKKQNAGLTPLQKLILQVVVAAVFLSILRMTGGLGGTSRDGLTYISVWIPGTSVFLYIPWIIYLILGTIVIVGANNAVNLTDGIDGLAAGVTLPVAVFFAAVGVFLSIGSIAVFGAALAGGMLGFLLYNFHPAKVFMGDTGSLFLGGAVAGLAFIAGMPLILVPVGIVYIWETISVMIQVLYFKLTGGKRFFRMAPYHHHLEIQGWGERKIVFTGFVITTVCSIAALYSILRVWTGWAG